MIQQGTNNDQTKNSPKMLTQLSFIISILTHHATATAPSVSQNDSNDSKHNPFLVQVGNYLDPTTGLEKMYYSDGIYRTFEGNKEFCKGQKMEPVSPLSLDETLYITTQCNLSCSYYWTSGIQRKSWIWDIYTGMPIYDSPNWSGLPALAQCAALHRFENLHAMSCTQSFCSLCQIILYDVPTSTIKASNNSDFPVYAIIIIAIASIILFGLLAAFCAHYFAMINKRRDQQQETNQQQRYNNSNNSHVIQNRFSNPKYDYGDNFNNVNSFQPEFSKDPKYSIPPVKFHPKGVKFAEGY